MPNSIPIIQALKNPEPKFLDLVKVSTQRYSIQDLEMPLL